MGETSKINKCLGKARDLKFENLEWRNIVTY